MPSFKWFVEEHRAYEKHKAELLRDHEGRFVVIYGDDISDICNSYEDALEAGYTKIGLHRFFVKEVLKEDPVLLVTRLVRPCQN